MMKREQFQKVILTFIVTDFDLFGFDRNRFFKCHLLDDKKFMVENKHILVIYILSVYLERNK